MNTDSTPNESEKPHTMRRKRTIVIVAALVAFSACLICEGVLAVGGFLAMGNALSVLLVEALGLWGHLDVTGKYAHGKYTSPSGDFSCKFGESRFRYPVEGETLVDDYGESYGLVYFHKAGTDICDVSVSQSKMDKSSIPDSEGAIKRILIDVLNSDFMNMKDNTMCGERYRISNASVVETKFINENPLVLFAIIEANGTDGPAYRQPSLTIGYLSFISGDSIYQISMVYWPFNPPLTGSRLHDYLQGELTKFYEGCEFR